MDQLQVIISINNEDKIELRVLHWFLKWLEERQRENLTKLDCNNNHNCSQNHTATLTVTTHVFPLNIKVRVRAVGLAGTRGAGIRQRRRRHHQHHHAHDSVLSPQERHLSALQISKDF